MARRTHEEYFRAIWCTAIASPSAPTTTEINAGVDFSTYIPKDGFKTGASNDRVTDTDLSSAHKSEYMGAYGEQIEVTFYRGDSTDDAAYTTFVAGFISGFWVVRRLIPFTTAFASTQKLEVYPSHSGHVQPADTAENELVKFVVPYATTGKSQTNAAVA